MHIPQNAVIAEDKLTKYLLVQRQWDDKSRFLEGAGFTLENWTQLRNAIREIIRSEKAVEDGKNEYGTFFRVDGLLNGPNARLPVTLIWMQRTIDRKFYFVTLKPRKE